MQKDLIRLIANHLRLGCTQAILLVDAAVLLLLAADLAGYWLHTGSEEQTLFALSCLTCAGGGPSQIDGADPAPARSLSIFIVFMAAILPLLLGVARVVSRRPLRSMDVARRPGWVLLCHLALCSAFVYYFLAASVMRNLSGVEASGGLLYYGFSPVGYRIINLGVFRAVLLSVSSLVTSAATLVVLGLLTGSGLPAGLKHYMVRADLADLPSELRPVGGDGHASRRIAWVAQRSEELRKRYRALAAEPRKAAEWLDQEWESCLKAMRRVLIDEPANERARPDFWNLFTASGGACEAVLAAVPRPRLIVLSPYLSPKLRASLEWQAAVAGDTAVPVEFGPDDYFLHYRDQHNRIVEAAVEAARLHEGNPLVVLGEVFYASGRRLRTAELCGQLRDSLAGRRPYLFVDGTNAAGNRGRIEVDADWDFYAFSPERWLLAPVPCELLITRRNGSGRPAPPGAWRKGVRKSDADAAAVTGLHAALELIGNYGLEYFWSRSERLCEEVRLGMPSGVMTVGEKTEMQATFIIGCCPRPSSSWKLDADEIESRAAARSLRVSVVRLDCTRPWLRVTVPYYTDFQELRRVCEFLTEVVR